MSCEAQFLSERVAEWLRRLTRKPKVRTAVGSNPTLDSLVAVRYTSPGRPEPCEGNLVAVAGSCGGLMVKHPWPLLEISLSDFRGLATLNINTYLPTYLLYLRSSSKMVLFMDKIDKYDFFLSPFIELKLHTVRIKLISRISADFKVLFLFLFSISYFIIFIQGKTFSYTVS